MKFLGLMLLIIGLAAIALSFTEIQFIFLSWINNWGATTGWVIKIAMVVIGFLLYYFNRHDD